MLSKRIDSLYKLCLKKERRERDKERGSYTPLIIFRYLTFTLHSLDIISIILSSREGNYVTLIFSAEVRNRAQIVVKCSRIKGKHVDS